MALTLDWYLYNSTTGRVGKRLLRTTTLALSMIMVAMYTVNPGNRNPNKKLLGLNPRHIKDCPITQLHLNMLVVVNQRIKVHVTRASEEDLEASIFCQECP
ncbi:hypothetical protein ACFX12_013013 [Malus domestica]